MAQKRQSTIHSFFKRKRNCFIESEVALLKIKACLKVRQMKLKLVLLLHPLTLWFPTSAKYYLTCSI